MKKNPFEQFGTADVKEVNKGAIYNALNQNYDNGGNKISKTGAEIKKQILEVVLPNLKAYYDEKVAKIEDLLTKVGMAPTEEFCCYKGIKIDMPYKKYKWDELQMPKQDVLEKSVFVEFAQPDEADDVEAVEEEKIEEIVIPNLPQSQAEKDAREQYNECVNDLYDLLLDVKTCDVIVNNMKSEDIWWLTVNQLLALCFETK